MQLWEWNPLSPWKNVLAGSPAYTWGDGPWNKDPRGLPVCCASTSHRQLFFRGQENSQDTLFVIKGISDEHFKIKEMIQHTVVIPEITLFLQKESGTMWGERWSFSPLFCTDNWLMQWVWSFPGPKDLYPIPGLGKRNYYCLMPWWQKTARFPDMMVHFEKNR